MFEENALSGGFRRVRRHPQVLWTAYLVNFLTAGLLALAPAIGLITPAYSRAMREAADGIDFWFLEEIFTAPTTYGILQGTADAAGPAWLSQLCLFSGFLALLLPLLAWAPASLLSGGILLTYAEDAFHWRRFLWGCGHWFVAFSIFNLVQAFLAFGVFGTLLAGLSALRAVTGSWLNWIGIPAIGFLALLWLAVVESTRQLAVSAGTRNVFKASWQALRLVLGRPRALFSFYVLSFALLLLVHLAFRAGLLPRLPLAWWPLVFFATQAFILLRLMARLARWAGLATLAARHR
ncbi:MAG: hypothetical protein ACOYYS_26415 [Chloroflexota bacterium]